MLDLPENRLLLQDFGISRGYFAENFVAQELWAGGLSKLHAWQSRNSEIEFILQMNHRILPVEVKSGKRTQAKSLQQYIMRYSPEIAIKLSGNPLNINNQSRIRHYPLYMAGGLLSSMMATANCSET